MNHFETSHALAQITDTGLFERIATAVLREAFPNLYGNLTHPGTNIDGKTVKAPVDNISFVLDADPPRMVMVHHTSGSRETLREKWLHDPSTVKPRKGGQPTGPAGDVIKSMKIVELERRRNPKLCVTLALTTNKEPPEDLTRDVAAEAKKYDITIDLWAGSRIAHHLDCHPNGQWLRRNFLGIRQQLLSKQLLHEISQESIKSLPLMVPEESLISREIDLLLVDRVPRPIAFLLGESGLGKTVACFKYLKTHIETGGFGIVLTHDTLANNRTLEQALDSELRQFYSDLEPDAGIKALAFCTPENPLHIIIEDVNRSDQPAILLERLATWGRTNEKGNSERVFPWRLLCPLWQKTLAGTSDASKRKIETLSVSIPPFLELEARTAIQLNAKRANIPISPFEANSFATELGNDPLLIGLFDFSGQTNPQQVISNYIGNSLRRLACIPDAFSLTDYRTTLNSLGHAILLYRRIEPTWQEIQEWLKDKPNELKAIRQIFKNGEIVRLIEINEIEQVMFRHDRVRNYILSDAVRNLLLANQIDDTTLSEPFFSDIYGFALADVDTPTETAMRLGKLNPIALFYALKVFRNPSAPVHRAVLSEIDKWVDKPENHGRSHRTQRWTALHILAETDSPYVLSISSRFKEKNGSTLQARFRNGDIKAGIQLCLDVEPGVTTPWRDSLIIHAKIRFEGMLIEQLDKLLKIPNLSGNFKIGALRLAGHLADPILENAIRACWTSDTGRTDRLADYLWAAAQCCGDNPDKLLEPVCEAWADLPSEVPQQNRPSPREELAADHISWAFRKGLPSSALQFFIKRAELEDLRWPITYMLRGMDHPVAVEFIAREMANQSRQIAGSDSPNFYTRIFRDEWEQSQGERGHPMSLSSRKRLQELWENPDHDNHLRRQAFLLWDTNSATGDIELLQQAANSVQFNDDVLRARLKRGDTGAIPLLVDKLESDEYGVWWQLGRHIWSDVLTHTLDKHFQKRGVTLPRTWGTYHKTDWITAELVLRLNHLESEKLLTKHWEHLRYSSRFVVAALYIATPSSRALAHEVIISCPDPKEILTHINLRFGIKTIGHPGVTRKEQIEGLTPYLDYLDPSDIHHLWELCNERKWFDFRRIYLDNRLEGQWLENAQLDESRCFAYLDKECNENKIYNIDFWIDRKLKQGLQPTQIFQLLEKWLHKHRTLIALEAVATALIHVGKRTDLELLCMEGIEPAQCATDIFRDTSYAISQRSLL